MLYPRLLPAYAVIQSPFFLLLQYGAVLSPVTLAGCSGHPGMVPAAALCCPEKGVGRGAPHQWSSPDPSVTSACLGPLAVLFL